MIILSIRLFFSTARRTNQEAPPQLSGACLYSNPPLLLSLRVFLTPPSLRTPPLYFAAQNTEEEGESNPPLVAVRYPAYGVRQGRIVIQRTFFPCQRKRRRSYRAFWLVATVAVGVCGTRSAQTVLALFPPSSLRLHRPIKAESGIVAFACILTPSPYGHSPCVSVGKYRGETEGTAVPEERG